MKNRSWMIVAGLVLLVAAGCGTGSEPETSTESEISVPEDAPELEGTGWVAESINGQGVSDEVRSTLVFEADRKFAGSAGCNNFFGSWSVESDQIAFGHVGATMMMCPPEMMEQEQRFLEALNHAERFEFAGGKLLIHSAGADQPTVLATFEPPEVLTGVVLYRERIALPPHALLTVRLVDVSKADAAAVVLGEQVISPQGQVPIPFEIQYDSAAIDERMRYAVQARIEVDGELRFITQKVHPVLTQGHPSSDVEVLVRSAGS